MRLKYINLNLWLGGRYAEKIGTFLQHESADIVALQEAYYPEKPGAAKESRSYTALKETAGYRYGHFAKAFLLSCSEGTYLAGNAVFSKYPLRERRTLFYDVPFGRQGVGKNSYEYTPRNLQHVEVQIGGKKIQVFNTQGIWGTDDADNSRRLKMADTITEATGRYESVILSGDFNVDARTKTVEKIERHLRNVFKDTLKTTFNMRIKTGGTFGRSVVDMIFVSPGITIHEASCPDIDISDHLPQIVVLEI